MMIEADPAHDPGAGFVKFFERIQRVECKRIQPGYNEFGIILELLRRIGIGHGDAAQLRRPR